MELLALNKLVTLDKNKSLVVTTDNLKLVWKLFTAGKETDTKQTGS